MESKIQLFKWETSKNPVLVGEIYCLIQYFFSRLGFLKLQKSNFPWGRHPYRDLEIFPFWVEGTQRKPYIFHDNLNPLQAYVLLPIRQYYHLMFVYFKLTSVLKFNLFEPKNSQRKKILIDAKILN